MPSQYRHYMMQTTVGPSGVQSASDYPVYNPYLEGPKTLGTTKDCVECHIGAKYDPRCVFGKNCKGHGTGHRIDGTGKEESDEGEVQDPGPCKLPRLPNNAPCLLYTDFIWSLATSQDEKTGQPQLEFIHRSESSLIQKPSASTR
jgi:hypothetical protein